MMTKFPKIGSFAQVVTYVSKYRPDIGIVQYEGTVKLHGTNAGIRYEPDGAIVCQSRNKDLSLEDDNQGFARFVYEHLEHFQKLRVHLPDGGTLFGEFVGPGIHKGVAVNQLPKHWIAFAAHLPSGEWAGFVVGNDTDSAVINDVRIVAPQALEFDITDPVSREQAMLRMEQLTAAYDASCPYAALRGVQGPGEGLVWMPVDHELRQDTNLWFKTKGPTHRLTVPKEPRLKDTPEKAASALEFANMACAPARLEQGLVDCGLPLEMASTGGYIKWVLEDVEAELSDDLEASGLSMRDVHKFVGKLAAAYYKQANICLAGSEEGLRVGS